MERSFFYLRKAVYTFILVSGICLSLFLFFKYLFEGMFPFIFGFIISIPTVALRKKVTKKKGLSSKILTVILLSLFSSVAFFLLWLLISRLVEELTDIANNSENLIIMIQMGYDRIFDWLSNKMPTLFEKIDRAAMLSCITQSLSKLSLSASLGLAKFAMSIPDIVLFLFVTVLSAYYFSVERSTMLEGCLSVLPFGLRRPVHRFIASLKQALIDYFKAGGLFMLLCFIEMTIGFLLIGVDYAVFIALIVAAVDFLPVFGTGTILLPWAGISFITGDLSRALWLIVIWAVSVIIRQLLEPRVLGSRLNIHPMISLLASYLGYRFFGVSGLVFLPIISSVVVTMLKNQENSR